MPGAYSEAAALKAYPKCETVPCDQFEAAFKVSCFTDATKLSQASMLVFTLSYL